MLVVQNATRPAAIRHALADLLHPNTDDLKIASAYVTLSGMNLVLAVLRRQLGDATVAAMPKTLVTSFDFGLTEPAALNAWLGMPGSEVRVSGAPALQAGSLSPAIAFHPKLYLFGYEAARSSVLVGSANLTSRGFSINTEAAWAEVGVARQAADEAFGAALEGTVALTAELLAAYQDLRAHLPPPPQIAQEVEPVPQPAQLNPGSLTSFRDAVEAGQVDPTAFDQMWVHVESLQGGARNQLELPREAHRFFGLHFVDYEAADKVTIGVPILAAGAHRWTDRLLTWHGNNRMERMNLPTQAQGGYSYSNSAVMFRRKVAGEFELIVAPWDSDIARSWREASAQSGTLFRLGQATSRVAGFI